MIIVSIYVRDEKVVHPNWIMDSVVQGKLLPYRDYLLYGARVHDELCEVKQRVYRGKTWH